MTHPTLTKLERELFGGRDSWRVYEVDEAPTVFLMDAEYDPVRVTFCGDVAEIQADGNRWTAWTPEMLRRLADIAEQNGAKA